MRIKDFKIGDKVEVIDYCNEKNAGYGFLGDIGEVVEVGRLISVKFKTGDINDKFPTSLKLVKKFVPIADQNKREISPLILWLSQ